MTATAGATVLLIGRMAKGSESAFASLVSRFWRRATRLAHRRLGPELRKAVADEDVALSAFHRLWKALRQEPSPIKRLSDREDLLRLLAHFTGQRVRRARRFHSQQRRQVSRTLRDADVAVSEEESSADWVARDASPESQVCFDDTVAVLLAGLEADAQTIVKQRLEGREHSEIARGLGCSVRTVERRLSEIRSQWQEQAGLLR